MRLRGGVEHSPRAGFTLAEVLITLGIIGVVAAMTIPTLVANYQEKSWNTSAQVFERKLTEALKVMNTQQTLAGHTTTQSFINELAKHFKIVKTCDSNNLKNCVEENITWNIVDISNGGSESESLSLANLKTAADLGKDWGTETIGVQFANGTTAIMAYDPSCRQDPYSNTVTGMSCISMIYDTSGGKSPNTTSKDVRAYNNKIANCAFKSGSTCYSRSFKADALSYSECEKIKNELGLTECYAYWGEYCLDSQCNNYSYKWYYPDDYLAGSVKACGHIDNLISDEDLAKIANYLYNTDIVVSDPEVYSVGNLTLDTNKLAKLGWTFSKYNDIAIWSSEGVQNGSYGGRSFNPNTTYYIYEYSRDVANWRLDTICKY